MGDWQNIRVEVEDKIAVLTIDHPPVNSLNTQVVTELGKAVDELLAVFGDAPFDHDRYVFHCYNRGPDDARKILDFGAWISFTGVVTFRNAREVADAAKLVPADRIMVETDAPFLSPEPVRKIRPNEPQYVVHISRFLADLRGVDPIDFGPIETHVAWAGPGFADVSLRQRRERHCHAQAGSHHQKSQHATGLPWRQSGVASAKGGPLHDLPPGRPVMGVVRKRLLSPGEGRGEGKTLGFVGKVV